MNEEEIAMIEWLKNAPQDEILAEMSVADKEIFREPIE